MPEIFERARRLHLELELEVRGQDPSGAAFAESCRTVNISSGAVCFDCPRRLAVGGSVELSIALPEALRRHFGGRPVYHARARVYRIEPAPEAGGHRVVARFVGDAPSA